MNLDDGRAHGQAGDVVGQGLVADDKGRVLGVVVHRVLCQVVKVGSDHHVVGRPGQQVGQHHISRAGDGGLHHLLNVVIAVRRTAAEALLVVLAVEAGHVLISDPQLTAPLAVDRLIPLPQLPVPDFNQLLAGLDTGGAGGARAQDKAELSGVEAVGDLLHLRNKTFQ